jgi:hypothetical protein
VAISSSEGWDTVSRLVGDFARVGSRSTSLVPHQRVWIPVMSLGQPLSSQFCNFKKETVGTQFPALLSP